MPSHRGWEAVLGAATDLIYTQEFSMLLGRAQRAPIIRRELDDTYIPAGHSADEVWDALTVIRRSQAFVSPDTKRDGSSVITGWHTMPESLAYSLRQIAAHTQRGSLLDTLVDEQSGRRFVTQQYVQEIVTNLSLDGFPTDYETVREALLGELPPAGDAQRLALNYHRIMGDMADYTAMPYDVSLLRDLYDRLTEGVVRTPPLSEQRSPLEPYYVLGSTDPEANGEDGSGGNRMLDCVADIANDRLTEPALHPIMVSMLVNCQFWHYALFPRCNNLMGCVASRLYLYRHGYPVFRYIPKMHLIWSWKTGLERSPRGYTLEESHAEDGRSSMDWTAYYDTVMQMMLDHIYRMEDTLGTRKAANDRAIAGIANIPNLNQRQIEVLRQAVVDPASEFRISWHQRAYEVVYSTARADLEKLAELGLLSRAMSGSTYVYRPVPGLAGRIMGYR